MSVRKSTTFILNRKRNMKFWDKFAFISGIFGLVVAIVGLTFIAVTGETLLLGKMILVLILGGSFFMKGLRAKRLAAIQNQEEDKQG